MVLQAYLTTKDYTRAEGDFPKETKLKGPMRQIKDRKQRVRKRGAVGRVYRMKYSHKGQKDGNRRKNRIKRNWASSVGLCQRHQPQHPHHVKVCPWGQTRKETGTVRVSHKDNTAWRAVEVETILFKLGIICRRKMQCYVLLCSEL